MKTQNIIRSLRNPFPPLAAVACAVLGLAAQPALAAVIYETGFEAPEYTGGPDSDTGHQLTSQGWTNVLGALPNFDVYTYAGNQVPYTPSGAVPVIGGLPQLVTVPQNPNGGLHFTANGNQSGDQIAADFSLIAAGLVEVSVDYYPGDWYDNNGGNYNGALTLRGAGGNQGGFYIGRGSAQPAGDVNGNGPWAPQWFVRDAANTSAGLVTAGGPLGLRFDGVPGFDNLARGQWHRLGMVYDKVTGEITQLKSQELIPCGKIYTINNPLGPDAQVLYILGGAGTPLVSTGMRLYNVGNGTLSGYDNLYVGSPYTWTPVGTIFYTGFESGEGYTGGTAVNTNQLVNQVGKGWTTVFGALPNFDVYTYAGAQIPYTPSGAIPVIGGIQQLITPAQNPNGGLQFAGNGNQSRDNVPVNFGLITSGLVEFSVDYFAGEWFDNDGGNYNGGIFLRNSLTLASGGDNGAIQTGRGSAQASGDANGNGPWAPLWDLYDSTNNQVRVSPYRGVRYDGVTGFDNLAKQQWYRIGMVFDAGTGKATQFKVQELIPGGNIYIMNNPVGPASQDLYIRGGAGTPVANVGLSLYNVGNGTLSAYDNLYAGSPCTWTQVPGVVNPVFFQITNTVRNPITGAVTLTWTSTSGASYKVEGSVDTITWVDIDDNVPGLAGETSYTDTSFAPAPVAPGKPRVLYRVTEN